MVREAEEFAEADKATKETVDARTNLEGFAYNLRNQVRTFLNCLSWLL